jgi:uncharacterized protein (TIGR00299 family) protein
MKTLYLDCFSGASGDMLLGALIDLGLKPSALEWELAKLDLPERFHLHAQREKRQNIEGIKFDAHEGATHVHKEEKHDHHHSHDHDEHHHHDCGHDHDHGHEHHDHDDHEHEHSHGRSFQDIQELISKSGLSDSVKQRSFNVFKRIADAEGKIHGVAPEKVTFHEVGAVDSIIDIIGFCIGVEKLGIEKIIASHLVEGSGWIECAHGRFPVPCPATLEILKGISLQQADEPNEMITPTGAALLAEFAIRFGTMPTLKIEKIGYGLGSKTMKSRPNVLRAILGEEENNSSEYSDSIVVLETNLDDVSGEIIGDVQEKLFAEGALDVFVKYIHMKKNRPGILLSVLADYSKVDSLCEIILTHTSAFGVRCTSAERRKLKREIKKVKTEYGEVEVKLGYWKDRLVQIAPEFESCKKVAHQSNVPLQKIYDLARAASTK